MAKNRLFYLTIGLGSEDKGSNMADIATRVEIWMGILITKFDNIQQKPQCQWIESCTHHVVEADST